MKKQIHRNDSLVVYGYVRNTPAVNLCIDMRGSSNVSLPNGCIGEGRAREVLMVVISIRPTKYTYRWSYAIALIVTNKCT